MAIDTDDLKSIFKMFSSELTGAIKNIQDISHLEQENFSDIVSKGLVGAMDSSVKALQVFKQDSLQQQETTSLVNYRTIQGNVLNGELAIKQAQSTKDLSVKDAEITYKTKQGSALDAEIAIKQAESTENVLIKKKQQAQIERQTRAYDDKNKIEKANVLKDILFSYNMSEIALPSTLSTVSIAAANAIYPE